MLCSMSGWGMQRNNKLKMEIFQIPRHFSRHKWRRTVLPFWQDHWLYQLKIYIRPLAQSLNLEIRYAILYFNWRKRATNSKIQQSSHFEYQPTSPDLIKKISVRALRLYWKSWGRYCIWGVGKLQQGMFALLVLVLRAWKTCMVMNDHSATLYI